MDEAHLPQQPSKESTIPEPSPTPTPEPPQPPPVLDNDNDGDPNDTDCAPDNANIHSGALELCDELDNNCNGQVDEGFPYLGQECSDGLGACHTVAKIICSSDGTSTVCPIDEIMGPGDETCDGIDNDCDGQIGDAGNFPLRIGQYSPTGHNFSFNGKIDDVRIYNRPLTQEEITTLSTKPEPEPAKDPLVAHYDFDDAENSGKDKTKNENDCKLEGDTTASEGKIGKGTSFDGNEDFVNCGNKESLNNLKSFTYAAWIRISEEKTNTYGCIVCKDQQWAKKGLYLTGRVINNLQGYIVTDGQAANSTIPTRLMPGRWYHVAMTYDDSGDKKIHLFLDGKEPASYTKQTAAVGELTDDAAQQLMLSQNIREREFNGDMDDARVYKKALTAEEIQTLFNEGSE